MREAQSGGEEQKRGAVQQKGMDRRSSAPSGGPEEGLRVDISENRSGWGRRPQSQGTEKFEMSRINRTTWEEKSQLRPSLKNSRHRHQIYINICTFVVF